MFAHYDLHETGVFCKVGDMTGPRRKKNTAQPGTVVAYIRVSKDDRKAAQKDAREDDPLSLEAQRASITAEAQRRGWTIVDWFEDCGISGGKKIDSRPELAAAIEAVKRGDAAVLMTAKSDRLARGLWTLLDVLDRVETAGGAIVAVDGTIDTSTPGGTLYTQIMGGVAEHERAMIAQRTREALAVLKSQGVRLGRPCVTPAAVKARVVAEREAGSTLQEIADGLNGDGTPTARGGLVWHPSTVRAVLQSHAADALALAARSA